MAVANFQGRCQMKENDDGIEWTLSILIARMLKIVAVIALYCARRSLPSIDAEYFELHVLEIINISHNTVHCVKH